MKNNILLYRARKDNANDVERFNRMCFDLSNAMICTNPDLADSPNSSDEEREQLFKSGLINSNDDEGVKKLLDDCDSAIDNDFKNTFFIGIDCEIVGYITADLSGTRSIVNVNEIGILNGRSLDDEELDTILTKCAKAFKKIEKIRIMSPANKNTIQMLQRIGFEFSGHCLEKKVGGS